VSRKFRSSCCSKRSQADAVSVSVNQTSVSYRFNRQASITRTRLALFALPGASPPWPGPAPRPSAGWSCRAPSTRRWPATRACAKRVAGLVARLRLRRSQPSSPRDGAPPRWWPAPPACMALPQSAALMSAYAKSPAHDAPSAAGHLSDLQFTGRLPGALPVQPTTCVQHLEGWAASCSPPNGVTVTDLDGNVFYDLHGLLRRQPVRLRLLQALHRGRAAHRPVTSGPVLGSYHPVRGRQRAAG